jgi:hypothetical protein
VHWIAQVMGYACLMILKQTGVPESPLYWEKHTDWHQVRPINDYLVDLFHRLLEAAAAYGAIAFPGPQTQIIEIDIATLLSQVETI